MRAQLAPCSMFLSSQKHHRSLPDKEACHGTFGIWLIASLLASAWLTSTSAQAQTREDYRCVNGDDARLIEIRFEDDQGSLPCRVIYRPETETDTVGIVSWRGLPDLASCQNRASEVVDRLTGEGWTCAADQILDAAIGGEVEPLKPQASEVLVEEQEEPETDEALVSSIDSKQIAEVDIPARLVDNPALPNPPAELLTIVKSDLAVLDTTLDGQLEATVAGYGDLDDDDLDDIVVLYTYISPQPAHRQFLAAYMFDGENYQMRATKSVGGNINGTTSAKVEAIDRGVIHLSLQVFQPGDASCCPTGTDQMTIKLHDLDLVEIETGTLTR